MKFPKVQYKYLGDDINTPVAEYYDNGACKGHFGVNPHIIVNLSHIKNPLNIPYVLMHEMVHFIVRPLPSWLEKTIDISLDVTLGKHDKELVFRLYNVFDKEECLCGHSGK